MWSLWLTNWNWTIIVQRTARKRGGEGENESYTTREKENRRRASTMKWSEEKKMNRARNTVRTRLFVLFVSCSFFAAVLSPFTQTSNTRTLAYRHTYMRWHSANKHSIHIGMHSFGIWAHSHTSAYKYTIDNGAAIRASTAVLLILQLDQMHMCVRSLSISHWY